MEKYLLSETQLKYIIEESFNFGEAVGSEQSNSETSKKALAELQATLLTGFAKTKTTSQS